MPARRIGRLWKFKLSEVDGWARTKPERAWMTAAVLAPGARVEIRSAEWIVRRVDATYTGGYSLLVTGVSEIVRDKEARLLTEIEGKGIKVLDPAETGLVPDDSPQFRKAKLYLESLFRQSPPTDTDLCIGQG